MRDDRITLLGGSGSPSLTRNICDYLEIVPAQSSVRKFSEGNIFVKIEENVRGRDVYLLQSTAAPVNDNFMELLFWIDACKRASAASVTAIIPWFSYSKGDKKDEPRVSIRARVCADAIETAGADRVVTVDLHAAQIQGFFRIPVDDLRAAPLLCSALEAEVRGPAVIVSPDAGFAKRARIFADRLGLPLAIAEKQRAAHDEKASVGGIIGDVAGKTAILVDDFTISAGTLISAADRLLEHGASRVLAAVTHGVFASDTIRRIDESRIEKLFITDTVEPAQSHQSGKITICSIAPLIGEAIRRIHTRQSISVLFES
ncbi:ribose-phosphate diphosphokinase [bacterium]|nr:ribose-phosphate diphosphokinase [bacterium]